ncbi:conserved hypothetical protein [Leishmania braziliensis MHOM/BR/75/M2904]|uniref:Uncharacterized protein n=4 Tax=Viannia TaxID=37616 RepID=A4HK36_LEIBR|nr:conserved hypothetical protein [Leishmania braziliensis MHOM/BR/75/M2904]KAI5687460.1 hypothetical protein MNV84_06509 [Leishmania braziliensis]CAJ2478381.1 unnamed protein product [Leishmania braziliensis]CAJ2478827.1 unnamed protein product [Leishmania braziliensis]CAM42858.1 conserved hypothetical protein [Leishmania braziliensis MHOM/BR/75/M2904]SYZ68569.1 hypothetical_protein [Leishmania braziliensis MHOM/BR/75/M2904]
MGRKAAFDDVCSNEANGWTTCLETNLGSKDLHRKCDVHQQTFDTCVAEWRAKVGSAVQVKGENEGDPPFQCAAMSCLIGECLRKYDYNFDRCKPHTQFFKYCVKSFYGRDYIS